jgi:uncharacterized protein (DUF305 family)
MTVPRLLIGVLVLSLAVGGCGAGSAPGGPPAAPDAAPPIAAVSHQPAGATPPAGLIPAPSGAATPLTSAVAATPNGTDVAWLQLLIAMNERLVPVLALAPGRAADPTLARRADAARASRTAELSALRDLATRVTLPAENPHAGHDMPGMATAAQRTALATASGAEFDRLFAGALQAHLDQAARLCAGEQKSGADPAFRALAASIARTVAAEGARTG